jgi:hypothetical protein
MPESHHTPLIKAQYDREKSQELIQLRHPDPALTPKLESKAPSLQVRGSWVKIPIKSPGNILARFAFTSFIWKSKSWILAFSPTVI